MNQQHRRAGRFRLLLASHRLGRGRNGRRGQPQPDQHLLLRFNPGKKFKQMLKMIEFSRRSVVSEPEPQAGD